MPLCATHGATYANNFGTFPHSSIIGRPYGSTLHSAPPSRGFVTLLRPTPELWTLALPHRTQILYGPDMSFISAKLALGPGATIVEAGTGSGSFTHFLARCVDGDEGGSATALGRGWKGQPGQGVSAAKGSRVQTRPPKSADDEEANTAGSSRQSSPPFKATPTPGDEMVERIAQAQAAAAPTPDDEGHPEGGHSQRGRVWTFEFHAQRAQRAREELTAHGLCPRIVSLSHRNVCQAGFPSSLNGRADAAFLDLPAPWEAIPFLTAVLDPSATTRVACFSPCIEQVLRTVKALNACGFREVETYECLVRTHESTLVPPNGGENKDIEEVKARLREVAKRRKKASEAQRRRAAAKRAKDSGQDQAAEEAQNGGAEEEEEGGEDEAGDAVEAEQDDSRAAKRQRQADHDDEGKAAAGAAAPGSNVKVTMSGHGVPLVRTNVHSRVHPVMRGHTSYLTFALLLPRSTAATATADE